MVLCWFGRYVVSSFNLLKLKVKIIYLYDLSAKFEQIGADSLNLPVFTARDDHIYYQLKI